MNSLRLSLVLLLSASPQLAAAKAPVCETAASRPISSQRIAKAEAMLADAIRRGFAPGAILVVNQRGRPLIDQVIGLADRERNVAMRRDALFRLYSMTKPVTSVAAMQLVEQGKVGLDDPVSKFIPAFAATQVYQSGASVTDIKTEKPVRPLTVRDLLRHTAGMPYKADGPTSVERLYALRGIDMGSGADIPPMDGSPRVGSTAELAERIAGIPLRDQPGARFRYGNAVDVLGRVVEVASGERLRDYVAKHVAGPLGMTDSSFLIPVEARPRLTAAYTAKSKVPAETSVLARIDPATTTPEPLALIDDPTKSPYLLDRPIDYGGAGMVGTAGDYLRLAEALRQGGRLGQSRILNKATVDQMRVNQLPKGARSPELAKVGLGFGYGFAVHDAAPTKDLSFPRCGFFWSGAASTYFWIDPANQVSGVLMTQVFGGDVRSVWLSVLDALYKEEPAKPRRGAQAVRPPSIGMAVPVTNSAASEAR
ncbi:beta-lactamase family protein [Sphingomonas sp. BN140010]|uniref:Beta-lactamase family protein n=1 Tax=Sphingomonas arvum TaxID=2992113 RepID=A0ABT3JDR0_9SPHN|nr:serine hydrolase domain-containing protein [Sphingomonas sp. BN140010]MCW3796900.1 beta-lactamase family protein [Sphingomonas sp. BN140010]